MLMSIGPVAVQTGTTTECEASARYNLHGAYKVFVPSLQNLAPVADHSESQAS